jgi:hypothetical protein
VSLALSESNRRKQMRDAAQGQQGMAPQPKVVDQGIASMAAPAPQPQMPPPQGPQAQAMPEDVGIGALPAPNMQGMAEGGIVAFAPGGSVPTSVAPAVTPANGSYLKNLGAGAMRSLGPLALLGQHLFGMSDDEKRKLAESDPVYKAQLEKEGFYAAPAAKVAPAVEVAPVANPTDQRLADKTQTAPTNPPTSAPRPPAGDGPASLGGDKLRAAAPAPSDFMSQYEAARKDRKITDPYAAEEAALQTAEEAAAKKRLSSFEADVKEKGDIYAKREARIGKREGELEKSKDTNMGLAFLEAGLGMMQSKGRGLAGIAQGATVGVKSYAAGIDKLKTAQEKLDDARDKMEELRQNETSMDKRERRSLEADIDKTVNQGKRAYLGAQRLLLGKDEALTQTAVASDIAAKGQREQRASTERIAAAQAQRAVLADVRADERSRRTAAADLAKNAQVTIKDPMSTVEEKTAAQQDLQAAMGVLRGLSDSVQVSPQAKADVAKYLNPAKPPTK